MKTLLIAAALGATALGGIAYAAQPTPMPAPVYPQTPPAPHAPGKHADPNGDGVITRDEFMAQAARRFDRMDANHDGQIDQSERQAMRDRMGQGAGRRGWRDQGMDGMPPPPPPAPNDGQ